MPIHIAALVNELQAAACPVARFDAFATALGPLGIDQINYGFFDPAAASEVDAKVLVMSTMCNGWLEYYHYQERHLRDPHVVLVRQGNLMPYRSSEAAAAAIAAAPVRN